MNDVYRQLVLLFLMCMVGCAPNRAIPDTYKGGNKHSVYRSPDGDHLIVMYRIPMAFAMPGGSSDAPGIVCLFDSEGSIVKEKRIEMIQLMHEPVWSKDGVYIKLFVEWKLN